MGGYERLLGTLPFSQFYPQNRVWALTIYFKVILKKKKKKNIVVSWDRNPARFTNVMSRVSALYHSANGIYAAASESSCYVNKI